MTVRELQADPSGATKDIDEQTQTRGGRATVETSAARREPAVPADIVARGRAAIRRANRPASELGVVEECQDQSPEPTPVEPELPIDSSPGDPVGASVDVDSAVVDPPDRPSEERVEVPAPTEAAAHRPAPWEASPGHAVDPAVAIGPPTRWPGYNPDYVADQMVPMIHARATTGWRSWLGLRPSKAELLRKRLQAEMCVNFGQPVKIVLANPRGYAGKTAMAICLAGVLGVARGGGVCAFENHELRGTMSLRTVTNGTQRTTRDFIHNLSQMTPDQVRQADLSRYVRHQHAGNFDAMVTSRSFEKQLDGEEYRAASALLGRFYEVIVVDTANNEAHEAFQAAMEDATVLVVPTKWRPTHITPAAAMLNDMATRSPRHRLLVQNAVVVATNGVNEAVPGAREMALPMFSSLADTLIEIPADPHIEADRPILLDQLRPRTRRALDEFGAAVSRVAVKNLKAMEEVE